MEISLYKRNMDFIKKTFPDFHEQLTSSVLQEPGLSVSEAGHGGNFRVAMGDVRCTLHSTYDTDREMDMLFKPLTHEENQVIVIFGLGYGHCVDYIRKKHIKYKRLVIFEPCSNILMEVLKKRPVLELLGMRELYLHMMKSPVDMASYLLDEALESKTLNLLYHMSYMSLFKETYDNVMRSFHSERISHDSSIATIGAFTNEWNVHQLKTLQRPGRSAEALVGKFKGVPAIMASAGPSLEQHFELLREIGDRALIAAPGSTTRILNARDINAQLAVSIDSNVIQSSFYKDYHLDSVLVAAHRLHPDVFNNFPNAIFRAVMTSEHLTKYYYDWLGEKPFILNDHASVSSSTIDMLALMGCDPIIIVGQDLSFPDNRNYAGEAADTIAESRKRGWIEEVNIYGEKVFTDGGYKAIQRDMEHLGIYYRDTVTIVNATEGGLNIPGIKNVRLIDMFEQYIKDRAPDVKERIAAATREASADAGGLEHFSREKYGQADSGGDTPKKTVSDFFGDLLDSCGQVEVLLAEKEARFAAFAKLLRRGMPDNRLNAEMRLIEGYNIRLDGIPFFKQVVGPSIASQVSYYRAAGKHIADSSKDWEGALGFQGKFDEHALAFVNKFKAFVLREMISDAHEGVEQAGN